MCFYTSYLIVSFLVSLLCGILFIPRIVSFCIKKKLYDIPNARKIHKTVVPRLGGVCFMPCMLLSFLIAMVAFGSLSNGLKFRVNVWAVYFFIGLLCIYAAGFIDDLVGLRPKTKFLVQIFAAMLLPLASLYVNDLYGFCGIHRIPLWVGAPLTVFVIVFVVNAMNLIDGIDGLSSGLSMVALGGFLLCFVREGMWVYGILISGLMGVLLSFMYYNIFGKPGKTKIFMGDSGSLTIGFILGVLFVKLSMNCPNLLPYQADRLPLAYSLLIVPVFDVVRVIIVRLFHRRPLFGADKNHIHHKLMRAGLPQRQALLVIIGVALLFVGVNVLLYQYLSFTVVVVADILVWVSIQEAVNVMIRRRGNEVFFIDPSSKN